MAIIPGKSIKEWATVKPSSFAVWCALCEEKRDHYADVYLELEKAKEYGIEKTAFYHAFTELVDKKWIRFSRKFDDKKWWILVKGFGQNSAFAEKAEAPNSANAEKSPVFLSQNSVNAENSANTENLDGQNSANAENSLPYIKPPLKEPQDSNESFGGGGTAPAKKSKPVKIRLPEDFELTDAMIDWAKTELPKLRLIEAHENFVEHWTNRTDAKSERVDWGRTWKKGMRLAYEWQLEKENGSNQNGKGKYPAKKSNADIYDSYGYYS